MEINMKNIAIIPNHTKDVGLSVTKKLIDILSGRAKIYMNKFYRDTGLDAIFCGEDLYDNIDAVIVLGGDGTILRAAEPCAAKGIPIMGINLGRVGFMTEIEVGEMETAAKRLLDGDYDIEERMMMSVSVCRSDGNSAVYYALNDVVISKSDSEMISAELCREGEKINEYIADGVIISTPTGSTGYSLSAGGPVADPAIELFIATPICAHRLSSRSAILPADKNIRVRLLENGNSEAVVTVDGQVKERIVHGEFIEATKAAEKVSLIRMTKQSFYDILKNKLS